MLSCRQFWILQHKCLTLVICYVLVAVHAANNYDNSFPVTRTKVVRGWHRAVSDDDNKELYRDNLEADLQVHVDKQYPVTALVQQLAHLYKVRPEFTNALVVKDGAVYLFKDQVSPNFGIKRAKAMARAMQDFLRDNNLGIPNTLFIFNSADVPMCRIVGMDHCKVPMFSLFKKWDMQSNSSSDPEILLPHFGITLENMSFFPWQHKKNSALLRATLQKTMSLKSTRLQLVQLADRDNVTRSLLDVGLIKNNKRDYPVPPSYMKQYVGMSHHSRWKFVINTDGHTAAVRMGGLMCTNSVILKEKSPWIEYYYRSIRDGLHYYDFDLDTILPLMTKLNQSTSQEELKAMVARSQQFAYRYFGQQSKILYLRQALLQYNSLIPGVTSLVDRIPVAQIRTMKKFVAQVLKANELLPG